MNLMECLEKANLPKNETIRDNFIKAYSIINNPRYENIMCSISGGSDSDIMLDIIYKVDVDKKVHYVWFNTGLEYQATKDHLTYLENRYGITIERERAIKPIPLSCKEYGQPFLSKEISNKIYGLQSHNFDFKDREYEEFLMDYPDMPKDVVRWWCNVDRELNPTCNMFTINRKKYLKEFLILNPPTFKISSKCCIYAKKNVSHKYIKNNNIDLCIIGVRKAEGGIRSTAYKNCYDSDCEDYDKYRPLFWYSDSDKLDYEKACDIVHSDCYKVWGFAWTGCVGCPYAGRNLTKQLNTISKNEPKLYKAVMNIFKDTYEYTKKYHQFQLDMKRREQGRKKLF